jgi:5'-methylthioadenosine phosphorylase
MNQPPVPAEIGVIGGSGLYALLDGATEVEVSTPYGPPSDPITVAEVGGRQVAFLPRHGRDHRFPPHKVPYRANLWALRSLGVRQIIAPCAVGGLRPELGPGTFVVPDQLIDRTSGRAHTYYDAGAVHVSFADPYCPDGRATVLRAAAAVGPVDGGEAVLARELELCYTTIALVTDLDAGVEGEHGVTQEEVFSVFADNTAKLRTILLDAVTKLPVERSCPCGHALDGLKLPFELP